jgi:hypothetical protein
LICCAFCVARLSVVHLALLDFHSLALLPFLKMKYNVSLRARDQMLKTAEFKSIEGINPLDNAVYKNICSSPSTPTNISPFLKGTGKLIQKQILPTEELIFMGHHGVESDATWAYLLAKMKKIINENSHPNETRAGIGFKTSG